MRRVIKIIKTNQYQDKNEIKQKMKQNFGWLIDSVTLIKTLVILDQSKEDISNIIG
jgi:hypothetical protein